MVRMPSAQFVKSRCLRPVGILGPKSFFGSVEYSSKERGNSRFKLKSPVSGTVIQINKQLRRNPRLIKEDPYGRSWLLSVRSNNVGELKQLMRESEYKDFISRRNREKPPTSRSNSVC